MIDLAVGSIEQAAGDCDVIVVASPVDRIAALVIEAATVSPAHCLVTDVGSTKGGIVAAIARKPSADRKFLAAHPIAGSEKSGAEHASATLFDEKVVVLTPTDRTDPALLEKARHFWRLTGGSPVQMSPSQHDVLLAAISHVPHLVSALIAKMAPPEARPLAGSGWQDITRVAAGDPTLWTAICQENRDSIRQQLGRFSDELNCLRRILDDEDDETLRAWFAEAKQVKEQTQ
jgi:prephenate dehydrogenase